MRNLYNEQIENHYSARTNLEHRRSLGQFFTPFRIALLMSEWVLGSETRELRILDPAAGFGIFERAITSRNESNNKKLGFDLWEIDRNIFHKLTEVVSTLNIRANILNGNFMLGSWEEKYDGIIANPPYYKHHHIQNKEEVHEEICLKTCFRFSLQTNIYCWFLIKSMNLLNTGGRLAFIVPSEFLNANYGEKVKAYLAQSGIVVHLININFEENVFNNALTTSIIILAERGTSKNNRINFYSVEDIAQITDLSAFLSRQPITCMDVDELDPKVKWRNYFKRYEQSRGDDTLIPFSKLGRFSRGIATGANKYFTLSERERNDNNLSSNCLLPCITKATHAKDIRFTQNDFDNLLRGNRKVYLFDGERCNDLSCTAYIGKGEDEGVDKRYLTRNRKPWYALEKRAVSKIWVSVFGRRGIKFVWNETNCLNLTCFHAFYPSHLGKKYLDILFLYLNTDFAKRLIDREKREYGNGLGKFEPNDINKALIFDFERLAEKTLNRLREMQRAFLVCAPEDRPRVLEEADDILRKASEQGQQAASHQVRLFRQQN